MTAIAATRSGLTARHQPDRPRLTLYAESFALPPDGFSKVLELRLHHVGHRLARRVQGVADFLTHLVHRHAVPQLAAAFRRPPRADHRAKHRGRQQVVLLVTIAHSPAVGLAVAHAIRSRFRRRRHWSRLLRPARLRSRTRPHPPPPAPPPVRAALSPPHARLAA